MFAGFPNAGDNEVNIRGHELPIHRYEIVIASLQIF